MNFLRPLIAGIATGVGMRFGSDLYDKLKKGASSDEGLKGFNPFKSGPEDASAEASASTADSDTAA